MWYNANLSQLFRANTSEKHNTLDHESRECPSRQRWSDCKSPPFTSDTRDMETNTCNKKNLSSKNTPTDPGRHTHTHTHWRRPQHTGWSERRARRHERRVRTQRHRLHIHGGHAFGTQSSRGQRLRHLVSPTPASNAKHVLQKGRSLHINIQLNKTKQATRQAAHEQSSRLNT